MARPEKYKSEYVNQAAVACRLGATDLDLADMFEVSIRTINYWKANYEEFAEAVKLGKEPADNRVERSLFMRAVGYSHEEDDIRTVSSGNGCSEIVITPTIKHYPPDTAACIFWLKNRRPDQWRANPEPGEEDYVTPVKIEVNVVDASVNKPEA